MKSMFLLGKAIAAFGVSAALLVWLVFMEETQRPFVEKIALAVASAGAIRFYVQSGIESLRARSLERMLREIMSLSVDERRKRWGRSGITMGMGDPPPGSRPVRCAEPCTCSWQGGDLPMDDHEPSCPHARPESTSSNNDAPSSKSGPPRSPSN